MAVAERSPALPPELDVTVEIGGAEATRGSRPLRVHDPAAEGLRAVAVVGLFALGATAWARQIAPTAAGVAWQQTLVVAVLAGVLLLVGRWPRRRRRVAAVAIAAVVAGLVGLVASGIPLSLLWWREWGTLTTGVGQGLSALPSLNVPYRGRDEWVRWVIASGAVLLGILAVVLALGRLRRGGAVPAAGALAVLYGLAVVQRNPESPFVSGAAFTVGLALLLGASRLTQTRSAPARAAAAGLALAALGAGAVTAPALDADRPWINYRGLTAGLVEGSQTRFSWDHGYGPLDWGRDGRELLRVKARTPSYWKASSLNRFDGRRWLALRSFEAREVDTPLPSDKAIWFERVRFTVRGLRSEQYFTPGYARAITDVTTPAEPAGSGTWTVGGRALKQGDTFTADAYVPKPEVEELAAAGTTYPDYARETLSIDLPSAAGGPLERRGPTGRPEPWQVRFSPFGSPADPLVVPPAGLSFPGGGAALDESAYRRTWALARQLRAAADTPYELVQAVRARVQQNAIYSETPAPSRVPLETFLFDDRRGYCQQFSGAMALLLRMGGVPARVASGFTPGTFDRDRGEYVVRDLDAHSWVEVFFPDIGWVTFDPTPAEAPPRAQNAADESGAGDDEPSAGAARGDLPEVGEVPAAGADAATSDGQDGGLSPWLVVLGIVALASAGSALVLARRPGPPPLVELERALARSGRPVAPGTTLQALEGTLQGAPVAQSYVRALRLERYAGRPATLPDGGRRALRDELAAGLGPVGRLRAWWALPPRL